MKGRARRRRASPQTESCLLLNPRRGGPVVEYLGIDWSYRRAAWCSLSEAGAIVGEGAVPADADGLARLVLERGTDVRAVVEMMSGAIWGARPARRGRLAGADRPCPQGPRRRSAGVQDRQGRRARAGRARPPRSGARAMGPSVGGPRAARTAAPTDAPGPDARFGDEPHLRPAAQWGLRLSL